MEMYQHKRYFSPIILLLLILFRAPAAFGTEGSITLGRFGRVALYYPTPRPSQVVLFVSGDGGWNLGVVDMARELASLDAIVAGIDITHLLKQLGAGNESCSYPAADFEALSKYIQREFDFPRYKPPILVGYSSGATLVYATIVQAPPNTFRGAISLGFCPDLELSKPLCRGAGLEWEPGPKGKGYRFQPAQNLETPWIALQGTIDQVCNPEETRAYVTQVRGAEIVMLPKVGHGFSVPRNWMPRFKEAFSRLTAEEETSMKPNTSDALDDLPLVEVEARTTSSNIMAVIISGDGGWAGIDREVGNVLADHGISVVGLNSLQYFWTSRTPDGSARDLERILRHYLSRWKREGVVLIGYSLGADVLPFMASRLSGDLLERVRQIALIGPGRNADFEFHLTDWLGGSSSKHAHPILPEVEKLKGKRILCFAGEQEKECLCRDIDPKTATTVMLEGAHHFGGNYQAIAEKIIDAMDQ